MFGIVVDWSGWLKHNLVDASCRLLFGLRTKDRGKFVERGPIGV